MVEQAKAVASTVTFSQDLREIYLWRGYELSKDEWEETDKEALTLASQVKK